MYNMSINRINLIYWIFGILIFSIWIGSCTKMDDTYHDFWRDGEKVYPASPDSLKAFPGNKRIQLQWIIVGDPTIRKSVIYWNNRSDSLVVPFENRNTTGSDTVNVVINDLEEGTYSFLVYTFDDRGNRSVVSNVVGRVYGPSYKKSLLTRIIKNTSFEDDILQVLWGDPADQTSLGAEILYKSTEGGERKRFVEPDEMTTTIEDFDIESRNFFQYRTMFIPDSTAIDTFYTDYDTARVLGPRTLLPKSGWIAEASSYDNRNGRIDRLPEKAIDEDTNTSWVNLVGSTNFPHTLTIDMGEEWDNLYGVSLYVTGRNETPQSMEVYISGDGQNFELVGLYSVKNEDGHQFFDFPQPQEFRFVKFKFNDSYGSNNIVIFEAGVFTR